MSVRTIAVVGGLVQDLVTITERLPDQGETIISTHFSTHPGGKGANSAVAAYRLTHANPNGNSTAVKTEAHEEIQVVMVGRVGDDEFGEPLIKTLKANGVKADNVRVEPNESTGIGVVIVEADQGYNRILYYPGANRVMQPSDFMTLESLAGGVKPDLLITQLELRRETVEQLIETAGREGVDVLLNPAPALALLPKIYRMVTHLVVNETEAVMLSGGDPKDIESQEGWATVADYFLDLGVKNVVVTLGEQGAYYSNKSVRGKVDAEKACTVIDTTGAGYVCLLPSDSTRAGIWIFRWMRADLSIIGIPLSARTRRSMSNRRAGTCGTSKRLWNMGAKHQHGSLSM